MSFPNIPTITPSIDIDREQVINLLLASIALEEISLAHIVNAEAEKIQAILGTLEDGPEGVVATTIGDLYDANRFAEKMLRTVIKKEMLLQFKLEDTIDMYGSSCHYYEPG